jgi:hypothetical protein
VGLAPGVTGGLGGLGREGLHGQLVVLADEAVAVEEQEDAGRRRRDREYYLVGQRDTPDTSRWRTEIGWPIFRTSTR